MAIVNRDKDSSEQKSTHHISSGLVATGVTLPVMQVPYQAEIKDVKLAAQGLSGSPFYSLEVLRWGAGITAILGLANTLTAAAIGNSQAPQGFSLQASGNTLIQVEQGDLIVLRSGAANTAADLVQVTVVLQALQDIKTHFGS